MNVLFQSFMTGNLYHHLNNLALLAVPFAKRPNLVSMHSNTVTVFGSYHYSFKHLYLIWCGRVHWVCLNVLQPAGPLVEWSRFKKKTNPGQDHYPVILDKALFSHSAFLTEYK